MVALEPVLDAGDQPAALRHLGRADAELLRSLIEKHLFTTGSSLARTILDDFAVHRARFVKVMPHEYKRALGEIEARAAVIPAPEKAQKTAVLHG